MHKNRLPCISGALLSPQWQWARANAFCRTGFESSWSPWHCNKATFMNQPTGFPSTHQSCRWSVLTRFSCNNWFWRVKFWSENIWGLQKVVICPPNMIWDKWFNFLYSRKTYIFRRYVTLHGVRIRALNTDCGWSSMYCPVNQSFEK